MARVEVITGPERRRRWSEEQKRVIVAASLVPGAVISEGSVALTGVGWSYVPVAGAHAGRPNSLLMKLTSPASRSRQ